MASHRRVRSATILSVNVATYTCTWSTDHRLTVNSHTRISLTADRSRVDMARERTEGSRRHRTAIPRYNVRTYNTSSRRLADFFGRKFRGEVQRHEVFDRGIDRLELGAV